MSRGRTVAVLCAVAAVAGACDGGDSEAERERGTVATSLPPSPELAGAIGTPAPTPDAVATTPVPVESAPTTTGESAAPETIPETIPETGVPGLDSDDRFCAAWSRFGGTWQVLLVGSTFLDDADLVAGWEVASSRVVLDAYGDLLDLLPAELETERDALADGYFGALARRSAAAADALAAVGVDTESGAALGEAWLDALARRDPSTPDVGFAAPPELTALVDAAAAELGSKRVEFRLDPSLTVTVETPLTDDFLEARCPDQGTLAGGEVTG